jgi:hypothetical protein
MSSGRAKTRVDVETIGDAALVTIVGLVDEHFAGFGKLDTPKAIVLDVTGMSRMTSFGVRQWLKSMDALPKSSDVYLLGCATFFVDQLNTIWCSISAARRAC